MPQSTRSSPNSKNRRPTIRDVADRSGVSVCTASKAMRDGKGVAAETVVRIQKFASSIGYVPNNAARALASQQTQTLGVLVSNSTNRYYGTVLNAVNSVAQPRFYNVISGDSVDGSGRPQDALESLFMRSLAQHRVAGAIIMGPVSVSSVRAFVKWGIPIVFVDNEPPAEFPHVPAVLPDNFEGGRLAGEHLVKHGYRDFLLIGHPSIWSSRRGREQGFLSETEQHGRVAVVEGGYNEIEAEAAVGAHLDQVGKLPDCFFATNDVMLRGAMRALAKRGLSIGKDIGAVSFDEFDWAPHLSSPLTTIDQHIHQLGLKAIDVLFELIESDSTKRRRSKTSRIHTITPTLIVRESCGHGARTAHA